MSHSIRSASLALALFACFSAACGDDDGGDGGNDGNGNPDAGDGAGGIDAGDTEVDAAPDTPDAAAADASQSGLFEPCNPLDQATCAEGQKCAEQVLSDDPFLARTVCVPAGTVELGQSCTEGTPGETTGYDDCVGGAQCVASVCREICSLTPDSCAEGFACTLFVNLFDDQAPADVGVCNQVCNPVTQDCQLEGDGCYLSLLNQDGEATCTRTPVQAVDLTQGEVCYGPESNPLQCFLNGCAESYAPYLTRAGQRSLCSAYCSPVDTYRVDPDGNGAGPLNPGNDADGAAPQDCSVGRIGVPDHQCRHLQSFFVDANNQYIDYVPAEYGFCTPIGDQFGNCTVYSEERILRTYDEAGGGTDGSDAIAALCSANPAACSGGCARLDTLSALDDAYCVANPTTPSCTGGLTEVREILRAIQRR